MRIDAIGKLAVREIQEIITQIRGRYTTPNAGARFYESFFRSALGSTQTANWYREVLGLIPPGLPYGVIFRITKDLTDEKKAELPDHVRDCIDPVRTPPVLCGSVEGADR